MGRLTELLPDGEWEGTCKHDGQGGAFNLACAYIWCTVDAAHSGVDRGTKLVWKLVMTGHDWKLVMTGVEARHADQQRLNP
jgi:hypothetical protein